MDRETLIRRLMTTFVDELTEHVVALNRDLLALEKATSPAERAERLRTLFRTAHSLKGAARSVNVTVIENASHCLEEILSAAREGASLEQELFAVLFAAADAFEEAGMRLREEQDLTGSPLAALLPRLEAVALGTIASQPLATLPPQSVAVAASQDIEASEKLTTSSRQPPPVVPPAEDGLRVPRYPAAMDYSSDTGGGTATVRVPAEKLDAFLARSGELLVARRRVESRVQEIAALRDFVARWKSEWRGVEKPVQALLDDDSANTPRRHDNGKRLPRRAAQMLGRVGTSLRRLEKELDQLTVALLADGRVLKEAVSAIDEEVRRVRMLPFAEACQGLERMVRDLAQSLGKEVELVVEGGRVELDRSVLEGLKDPLRHLVRNAVDHGLESSEERRAAGKPVCGRITVAAVVRGATVEVVVADDGRGLDLMLLREQVRKRGLPEPADDRDLVRVIFQPGFSTSRFITDVSGRGVGLDVVKSRVEGLHGTVEVAFTPAGTRFTLAVPLTLTTLRALLVDVGGQTFAFVGVNVVKLLRVKPTDLRYVEGREMLPLGGTPLPVVSLAETLGMRGSDTTGVPQLPAVVVASGERRVAFLVDELLAEQEVVIKNLGTRIRRMRHVSAAIILPSGRIALVLHTANLIHTALTRRGAQPALTTASAASKPKKRLLVVDDSVTTRTLEKSILEAAGFEVTVAADGVVAWQMLQERGTDLLVSDVDMPRMDGITLTETVRASRRFADLPVVLVTARESETDRVRGVTAGANAYLVKSAFDQKNLLETIAQLL